MNTVYLNGSYIKAADAKISITDRGLLFGDGVYEVIAVYNGKPFLLDEHLTRLKNSLAGIYLNLDQQLFEDLPEVLQQLVALNGAGNLQIYLQITRGNYNNRKHDIPEQISPTIFAFTMHNPFPDYTTAATGIQAIVMDDIRWKLCYIKAITLLPNILLNHEAYLQGAQETILIRDGYAIEGMSSNLFIVKDKVVITPPPSKQMLNGITRNFIIKLAKLNQVEILERPIKQEELKTADEIWLTSTTRELRPVLKLDDQVLGSNPGPYWQKLYTLFQDYKQHYGS